MVSLPHIIYYLASATLINATLVPTEIGEGPTDPVRPAKKTGPFPPGKVKSLHYGPEFGVQYATIKEHPKNFDDTDYLGIAGDAVNYRRLTTFKCWHTLGTEGNKLTGEAAIYSFGKDEQGSNYHGWAGFLSMIKRKEYTLRPGESWSNFQVLACDGTFVGINAATDKQGGGVACGRYWKTEGDKGCQEKILTPITGHKIIGLYGDGNGVIKTRDQGLRGLGLITIPNKL